MILGMPTLIECPTAEESAKLCKMLGLQFVELNMNLPAYQLDAVDIPHLQAVAEQYGIFYTIHLDENLNVSDFNPYVAEAYLRTVRETIALAKELRAPILNMHLSTGVYFTLPERKVFLFDVYRERYLESMCALRDTVDAAIGGAEIKLCIENCGKYTDVQRQAIELLLQSSAFGLTFDIGHNACAKEPAEPFILAHGERLLHMHLHDADRESRKDHLALGTGGLDLKRYVALAKERNCTAVLETKTADGLCRSVEWMRKHDRNTE